MRGAGIRGWHVYAQILRAVIDGRTTAIAVAAKLERRKEPIRDILRRMHGQRLLHIKAWEPIGPQRQRVVSYGFGPGEDEPRAFTCRRGRADTASPAPRLRVAPRSGVTAFASIIRALQGGACTAKDLAEFCGVDRNYVSRLLVAMCRLRLVRVADWSAHNFDGPAVAMYEFEIDGVDAPRPAKFQRKQSAALRNLKRTERSQQIAMLRALTYAPEAELEAA